MSSPHSTPTLTPCDLYAWDGVATELKGYDTNFMDFAKLNTTFDSYTPIIIANNDFLAENPDTAKAFLAATAKGYEYAIEKPDAAANMLLEAAPGLDPEVSRLPGVAGEPVHCRR